MYVLMLLILNRLIENRTYRNLHSTTGVSGSGNQINNVTRLSINDFGFEITCSLVVEGLDNSF